MNVSVVSVNVCAPGRIPKSSVRLAFLARICSYTDQVKDREPQFQGPPFLKSPRRGRHMVSLGRELSSHGSDSWPTARNRKGGWRSAILPLEPRSGDRCVAWGVSPSSKGLHSCEPPELERHMVSLGRRYSPPAAIQWPTAEKVGWSGVGHWLLERAERRHMVTIVGREPQERAVRQRLVEPRSGGRCPR